MFSIFGFTKKNNENIINENINDNDNDDDISDSSDEEYSIFDDEPLITQDWGNNKKVCWYYKSAREIAPYLSNWCFNRNINIEHKNNIKNYLLKNENPHLFGNIQIVRDKNNKFVVVNGGHRLKAIQEILQEDIEIKFNMNLMFEICEIYDLDIDNVDESFNLLYNIFINANNSLNQKPEEDHDIFCRNLVIEMKKDPLFTNAIIDVSNRKVHLPKILCKDLYDALKVNLNPNHNMTIEQIIKRIKEINNQFSIMEFSKFYGRKNPSETKKKQHAKANEMKFYLNLKSKYPPEVWIQMIEPLNK